MNAEDTEKLISQVISLFENMCEIIQKETAVYSSFFTLIKGQFTQIIVKLAEFKSDKKFDDNTKPIFVYIHSICTNFLLFLQLIQKNLWGNISLSLEIDDPFDETKEFMFSIIQKLLSIKIDPKLVLLDESDIKASIDNDLKQLYELYTNPVLKTSLKENQKQKLDQQIINIKKLYEKYELNPPQLPKYKTSSVLFAREWEINSDDYPDQDIILQKKSYTIKRSQKGDQFYYKLEVPKADIRENRKYYQRLLMLLAALQNENLLPFIGGEIKDDCLVCVFQTWKDEMPLKTYLKSPHATTFTQIAYFVAKGIMYLHTRSVMCGNLNRETVFYSDKTPAVHIFPFSLLIDDTLDLNFKSNPTLPPECYLGDNRTFASDIYQFAFVLFALGKGHYPFSKCTENKDLAKMIFDPKREINFKDKNGNEVYSPKMAELIIKCLDSNPSNRPTAKEVVRDFLTGEVFLLGKDAKEKLQDFFLCQRSRKFYELFKFGKNMNGLDELLNQNAIKSTAKNVSPNQLTKENCVELTIFIQSIYNRKDKENLVIRLNKIAFFNHVIKFFFFEENDLRRDFALAYFKIYSLDNLKREFFQNFTYSFLINKGSKAISLLIEKDSETAFKILEIIRNYFTGLMQVQLNEIVISLIKAGRIDYVLRIIQKIDVKSSLQILSGKIEDISKFLENEKTSKSAADIITFYNTNSPTASEIVCIPINAIMKYGNSELLKSLMKKSIFLDHITMDDCEKAVSTLISKDSNQSQKDCSMLLLLSLDSDVFEIIAKFNKIIDVIISNENQELASRLIARLSAFQQSCEYIADKLSKCDKSKGVNSEYVVLLEPSNVWYLTAIARISCFCSDEIIKLNCLKDKLVKNLNEDNQIEGTVRVLGAISNQKNAAFWRDQRAAKSLYGVLTRCTATLFETKLILSVFANIAQMDGIKELLSNVDSFLLFLSLVEEQSKVSAISMRVLSNLDLNSILENANEKLMRRIVYALRCQLDSSDLFGIEGAAKLILNINASNCNECIDLMKSSRIDLLIFNASKNQNDPKIFINLMNAFTIVRTVNNNLQVEPLFANIIMNNPGKLDEEFYTLKEQMT